jgi:hypothetical protein
MRLMAIVAGLLLALALCACHSQATVTKPRAPGQRPAQVAEVPLPPPRPVLPVGFIEKIDSRFEDVGVNMHELYEAVGKMQQGQEQEKQRLSEFSNGLSSLSGRVSALESRPVTAPAVVAEAPMAAPPETTPASPNREQAVWDDVVKYFTNDCFYSAESSVRILHRISGGSVEEFRRAVKARWKDKAREEKFSKWIESVTFISS